MAEVHISDSGWPQAYLLSVLFEASSSRWEYLSRVQECLPLLLDAYSELCGRADLGPDDKSNSEPGKPSNQEVC